MTDQQQKDWLGPERYKLYKDYKLPLDRFIPPYPNKQMTIVELKEHDKASFANIPAKSEAKPQPTKEELHRQHLAKREKQRLEAYDNRRDKWVEEMKKAGVDDTVAHKLADLYTPEMAKLGKPPKIILTDEPNAYYSHYWGTGNRHKGGEIILRQYQDVIGSATKGKYGGGHKKSYYKKEIGNKEAFAQTFSAYIRKDEVFKLEFPNQWDYIDNLIKGLHK